MNLPRYMMAIDRGGVITYRYNPPSDAVEAGIVKRTTIEAAHGIKGDA